MFFMMGITEGRKDLDFTQLIVCDNCGKYGRFEVFMTYTVLSLFLIPLFRWNRRYYVKTSCCGAIYELDPEVGNEIRHGGDVKIQYSDLKPVSVPSGSYVDTAHKRCVHCGYETDEDFEYCPKCGNRL
ncbi:MAG: zinc ribbon domain-containing protein [Lachnospiraceae bacterium]|nr:zinc ribbon domain-containing protein [Lachnospiraceae bacterium]